MMIFMIKLHLLFVSCNIPRELFGGETKNWSKGKRCYCGRACPGKAGERGKARRQSLSFLLNEMCRFSNISKRYSRKFNVAFNN